MTTIWTIILAAGAGSRFGGPKALAPSGQGTLLSRAISVAPVQDQVVVVTGAHRDAMMAALDGVLNVHNPDFEHGMGTSIAAGIRYVAERGADIALIVPVDQPFVTRDHLINIADECLAKNKCVLTCDGDIDGPPAAIPRVYFQQLTGLTKSGLKTVLDDYGTHEGPGMLRDIDTHDDLKRLATKAF